MTSYHNRDRLPTVLPVRFEDEKESTARPVRSAGPTLSAGTRVEVYVNGRPVRCTVVRLEFSDLVVGQLDSTPRGLA